MHTIHLHVTDPEHLLAMGKARGIEAAIAALDSAREPGVDAMRSLRQLSRDQDLTVMQHSVRLAAAHGIDLNRYDITWQGGAQIVAEPHAPPI